MSDSSPSKRTRRIEAWLAEARAGSSESLGKLVETCRKYLLAIANEEVSILVRPKVSGSDAVQQTLLEACRDFAGFQGEREAQFLAWLRKILLDNISNLNRDFNHTAKRDLSLEIPFHSKLASELISQTKNLQAPSPQAGAMADEDQRRIMDDRSSLRSDATSDTPT